MARKNPVSQLENEICRRLRECRLSTSLSQVAFSKLLGIDSNRLSSYEHGRVPVRFGIALRAARLARVSLRWLAEGIEPKTWPINIGEETTGKIQENQLFSEAYAKWLKPIVDGTYEQNQAVTRNFDPALIKEHEEVFGPLRAGYIDSRDVTAILGMNIQSTLENLPPHLYPDFFRAVLKALRLFQDGHLALINEFKRMKPEKGNLKSSVDIITKYDNNAGVKAKLPELLKRLNKATRERGTKAALAKVLGVPLPKVSQWLSGKYAPGGETTLRLLSWVEQQERQK